MKVIGLSVDPVESHERWAQDIDETQGQPRTSRSSPIPTGRVSDLYGMIHPNASDTATVRAVFVIGPDKKIKLTLTYPQSTGRNFHEILRVHRLPATHRRPQGLDPGQLAARRGRHHRPGRIR